MHCIICGAGGCVCGTPARLRYPPLGSTILGSTIMENITATETNFPILGTTAAPDTGAGAYIATERLYLDKDGQVVYEDDPTRVELLLGVGGRMPHARAVAYGLIEEKPTEESGF